MESSAQARQTLSELDVQDAGAFTGSGIAMTDKEQSAASR